MSTSIITPDRRPVLRTVGIALVVTLVGGLAVHLQAGFGEVIDSHSDTARNQLEQRLIEPALHSAQRNTATTRLAIADALDKGNMATAQQLATGLVGLRYHDAVPEDSIQNVAIVLTDGSTPWRPTTPTGEGALYWTSVPIDSPTSGHRGNLLIGTDLPSTRADLARFDHEKLTALRGVMLCRLIALLSCVVIILMTAFHFVARARRRRSQPVMRLINSAEIIGEGNFSLPVETSAKGEIGDLAIALERLRQKLSQTTISRDYLNTVLNSMNDAVLVTASDGRITHINAAATKLLFWSEEELQGRDIRSLMDPDHSKLFDVAAAAYNTRETTLQAKDGTWVPVSLSGSELSKAESSLENPAPGGFIFVARNISERKRAEKRIHYLARHDSLTKLPNRMQYQHLLNQAVLRSTKNQTSVAVLYLDLDRFKDVNDTFGHAAGDRTLEILSERLARSLPTGCVIGRLAGDEFAIFMENLSRDPGSRTSLATLARQILDDVSRPFFLNNTELYLTASIGLAMYPGDSSDTLDMIRNADAAMYYAKRNGGNSHAFFAPEMNAAGVERLMLKSKLRRSVDRDEFVLRYLPKVDTRTGRICGAEALLRWRLPGHGDISPAHFIPLAEETNLILPIGEWVLKKVCADYSAWRKHVREPGRISINLSLRQLRTASFITQCRSVFKEAGVSPSSFELEITETTLMKDAKTTVPLLTELHDMGIHLSIDDFGTGYSSLSALQQMPVGTLKMDQSFVRNVSFNKDSATLVRTIIEMSRNLGMEVVAEGVESTDQLAYLRERGCTFVQGRLFGEPLTADELLTLLEAQERGVYPLARYFKVLNNHQDTAH